METEDYRAERDFILGQIEQAVGKLQDSALFPVLVKPWSVNKITCGSILTFFDNSYSDVTVSLDACLIALLIVNIVIFAPLFLADLNSVLDGGQFSGLNLFTRFQDRIDRIETNFDLESHFEAYKNFTFIEDTLSVLNNYTDFETSIEVLKNFTGIDKPLKIIDDIKMLLKNVTQLDMPEDEENSEPVEESLNVHRIPIHVYKYPVDGSFGSSFHGFESEKDEVLDLSGASDDELKAFYQLPRAFPSSSYLDRVREYGAKVMSRLLKNGEEVVK